jgi:hypothetical protein
MVPNQPNPLPQVNKRSDKRRINSLWIPIGNLIAGLCWPDLPFGYPDSGEAKARKWLPNGEVKEPPEGSNGFLDRGIPVNFRINAISGVFYYVSGDFYLPSFAENTMC